MAIKKIKIDGELYYGEIRLVNDERKESDDNTILPVDERVFTGVKAYGRHSNDRTFGNVLCDYLASKHKNELLEIELSYLTPYTEQELTDVEVLYFQNLSNQFNLLISKADPALQANYFLSNVIKDDCNIPF